MPYFAVKDANGDIIYVAATGAGTTGDPYVPTRTFTNSIPAGTAVIGKVDQGTGGASAWKVDGSGVTQPVSAASLPLPTGAATDGAAITGQSLESGGSGVFGWLSSLRKAITDRLPAALGAGGGLKIDGSGTALPVSGTLAATQSGTWTVQPGNTANTTAWLVSQNPTTAGGLSIYRALDANATGANVKASAGQLYGYYIFNAAAATRYVKLYNKATAPTVGTDTPVLTIPIPAGAGANVEFVNGIAFSLGIGIGATTALADNSTAAPTTNDVIVNLLYK